MSPTTKLCFSSRIYSLPTETVSTLIAPFPYAAQDPKPISQYLFSNQGVRIKLTRYQKRLVQSWNVLCAASDCPRDGKRHIITGRSPHSQLCSDTKNFNRHLIKKWKCSPSRTRSSRRGPDILTDNRRRVRGTHNLLVQIATLTLTVYVRIVQVGIAGHNISSICTISCFGRGRRSQNLLRASLVRRLRDLDRRRDLLVFKMEWLLSCFTECAGLEGHVVELLGSEAKRIKRWHAATRGSTPRNKETKKFLGAILLSSR